MINIWFNITISGYIVTVHYESHPFLASYGDGVFVVHYQFFGASSYTGYKSHFTYPEDFGGHNYYEYAQLAAKHFFKKYFFHKNKFQPEILRQALIRGVGKELVEDLSIKYSLLNNIL